MGEWVDICMFECNWVERCMFEYRWMVGGWIDVCLGIDG